MSSTYRERMRRQLRAGQAVQPRLSAMRDPIPALLSADEAYAYRERLAILCGQDLEPTEWERDLAHVDAMRCRREMKGELI